MTMGDIYLNISVPEEKQKKNDSEEHGKSKKLKNQKALGKSEKQEKKKKQKTANFISSEKTETVELPQDDVVPLQETLFSKQTFKNSSGLHPHLVANLQQLFDITKMTTVQRLTIPVLLSEKDALVRSQTGSGKTLAYAVPIMQSLQAREPKLTRGDGVKALIVLPTRELALQTYECFSKLVRAFAWIVPGILVGGEKRKSEKARLRKGITILVGTPGRLIDHAKHTKSLHLAGIDWLILDEADKLLDMGYEKDVSELVSIISEQREENRLTAGRKQTVLLSATLSSGVERLAGLTLNNPEHVDALEGSQDEHQDHLVLPSSLEQKYVVAPARLRLVTLVSFIIHNCQFKGKSKILVFMATQDMVDYYTEVIPLVIGTNVEFFKLHGNMTQSDRTEVFNLFRGADTGVLLCTINNEKKGKIMEKGKSGSPLRPCLKAAGTLQLMLLQDFQDVGARGLDLPKVDWIVQFTAPVTPEEYVHRVGRTARVGSHGAALLFLIPSELQFITWLNEKRIKLKEINIEVYLSCLTKITLETKDGRKLGNSVENAAHELQLNFERALLDNTKLHDSACKAYKSWVRFYASYPKEARATFDFKSLHLGHHAKCFALRDPPSSIGGIGKPSYKNQDKRSKIHSAVRQKKISSSLGLETDTSRTKRLIISEFDSGLSSFKKRKIV